MAIDKFGIIKVCNEYLFRTELAETLLHPCFSFVGKPVCQIKYKLFLLPGKLSG